MVRKTKEEALETKNAILSAAIDVFLEKGVASAGLEQIAEHAGVTRGAVYWHFKNKRSIFEALHEKLYSPLMAQILADMQSDHPCPLSQLKDLCTKMVDELKTNDEKIKILKVFHIKCDYSSEMEDFLTMQEKEKDKCSSLFVHYFDRAKEKNHLSPETDSELLALTFLLYLTGIKMQLLLNPNLLHLKTRTDELIDMFFNAIQKI